MIETGKMSPLQMAILMHPTILATAALYIPSVTTRISGSDMWMTPIISALIGVLTVAAVYQLHIRYPKMTFIEYCPRILGRWLGKALGLFYIFTFFYSFGIVLREYGEFVIGNFLIKTPIIIVMICLVAVCAFALYGGIEILARSAQILVPIAVLLIFGMVIALIPDMSLNRLQPFLGDGIGQPLLGSVAPASWYSQFFILSFLFPYVNKKDKSLKWSMISVVFVLVTLFAINLSTLLVFGTLNAHFNYPFLIAVRYISLADFFQHIEALLMAIWIMGIFVKMAVVYYVTVLSTAQWMQIDNYRLLIVPVGLLGLLFSIWVSANFQELKRLLETSLPFFALLMQAAVPLLLLLLAVCRGARPL